MNNGSPEIEPPSSSSLWGDMLGVGNFFKLITDPGLGAHAQAMMQAIIESGQASLRIERKLDLLLKALEHDGTKVAAALAAHGTDGTGRLAIASRVVDRGAGGPVAGDGGASRDAHDAGRATASDDDVVA